ncbi:MAG: formate dehydrogenase accessory sulfurtransferase FdhD, partial [Eggerthellaceae bacterium]|nr:formate dehydrogenase accessory sulfurtransferase FdhD [Eggerthellaceae bacterium]
MAVIEYRPSAPRTTAERPIRIFLNDAPVAVSQGSPYDLAELAVGYLLSEGLIADRERFVEVTADPEAAAVYVASGERAAEGYVPLHRVTSAGCARSALLADGGGVPSPRRLETAARFDADALLA